MTSSFRSARILAQLATEADAPEIVEVYEGNRELLLLLERENDPLVLTHRFVHRLNLPPKVSPTGLHNMILRDVRSERAIGLLSLYMGYPAAKIAYVGELFLHPEFHGAGLGREAYLRLESVLRLGPVNQVRVGVGLKNWNALRFWIRLGFAHITGMSGDRYFGPERHAFLELQKNL